MLFFDFEVFKHDWLVVIIDTDKEQIHEIINDKPELERIYNLNKNNIWIGYNSRRYDQYILKAILCGFNPKEINDFMIVEGRGGWEFSEVLNKIQIMNFDIMTSMHSLKQLEGFMGNNIKETSIPFDIDRKLTDNELVEVLKYCRHDVEQTIEVFLNRKEEFQSHLGLIKAFNLPLSYISKTKAQLSAIILESQKQDHNDEFEITIVDPLRLTKYNYVKEYYMNPINLDYDKKLTTEIYGVKHILAFGGIHGAIDNYIDEGFYIMSDIASMYPSLMINHNMLSRNVAEPEKFKQIRDSRIVYKRAKNPLQAPLKIVINGTYGASKDKNNALYDPLMANNVCINGQLLIVDLLEKLELVFGNRLKLIQSNTDGILVKLKNSTDYDKYLEVCKEWEKRTGFELEHDKYCKVIQKDVNNYIIVDESGKYKSKGAYVKKLNKLDYDLPIVNKALVNYFLYNIPVEKTILECDELIEFQKIVKVSSKYKYAIHNNRILSEKTLRVFASRVRSDGGIFKVKINTQEKIANTPTRCFIMNEDINGMSCPRALDKRWYVEVANKRIKDFKGEK
jgi:DNA polymerase elongation subunit (family B)